MQARFIQVVGVAAELYIHWGSGCPRSPSKHAAAVHEATKVRRYLGPAMERAPRGVWAVLNDEWPVACDHCGEHRHGPFHRTVFPSNIFDTESGKAEPGDLYWRPCYGQRSGCAWDNCPGHHLVAVCPNGFHWDTAGRASNCTRRDDKLHRCWVVHGTPPHVHIDKAGDTCAAGAGSIIAPGVNGAADWHGFLRHGEFIHIAP